MKRSDTMISSDNQYFNDSEDTMPSAWSYYLKHDNNVSIGSLLDYLNNVDDDVYTDIQDTSVIPLSSVYTPYTFKGGEL